MATAGETIELEEIKMDMEIIDTDLGHQQKK
jgi:hypothetical protein